MKNVMIRSLEKKKIMRSQRAFSVVLCGYGDERSEEMK